MRRAVPVLNYSEASLKPRLSRLAVGSGVLGGLSLFSFPLAIVVPYEPELWRAVAALALPILAMLFGGTSWLMLGSTPAPRGRWLCFVGPALGLAAANLNWVLLPSLNRTGAC